MSAAVTALWSLAMLAIAGSLGGCQDSHTIGKQLPRRGDEIVVAGRMFHIGTPVVLWTDTGGYDAYRTEKRFAPWLKSQWTAEGAKGGPTTPARYGVRFAPAALAAPSSAVVVSGDSSGPESGTQVQSSGSPLWTPDEFEQIRGGGWTLEQAQKSIDQFVIHYDVAGTSRQCFRTLHDLRGLSVHFMLDLDGTIYQTLDVKERAWHATTSNDRSVGIEIANMGAYAVDGPDPFSQWYAVEQPCVMDLQTKTLATTARITIPEALGNGGLRVPGPYFSRNGRPIEGEIQGQRLRQYDFTPEQYAALIKLTAGLCKVLPRIECDFPKDSQGLLIREKLNDEQLAQYRGLLGHFHIQTNKVDPGPAFDWAYIVEGARHELRK